MSKVLQLNICTAQKNIHQLAAVPDPPKTSIGVELQKFGEILLSETGDEFILCCTRKLCIEVFFEYAQFLKHVKQKHHVELAEEEQGSENSIENDWANGDEDNVNEIEGNQLTRVAIETPDLTAEEKAVRDLSTAEQLTAAALELSALDLTAEQVPLSTFDETTGCAEEIIWQTSDNESETAALLKATACNQEIQTTTNDDYGIEYLLNECLQLDDTELLDLHENEQLSLRDSPEEQSNSSNSATCASSSTNYAPANNVRIQESLIRNKRLLWYFIELYREHPCLWRADHEHIIDREQRMAAVENIAETMHRRFRFQISTAKVIKTIKSMRAGYLREYHRKSMDSLYKPKLWYFHKLSFIEDAHIYDEQQSHSITLQQLIALPKCSNCHREFQTKRALRQHLRMHAECKPFLCQLCSKSFRSAANLQAHMSSHMPATERSFTCEFCGLKIALQHNYLVHLRRHTKEFAHHCLICGQGTGNSAALKLHMLEHTGEQSHCCDICGLAYKSRDALRRHREQHTAEEKDS